MFISLSMWQSETDDSLRVGVGGGGGVTFPSHKHTRIPKPKFLINFRQAEIGSFPDIAHRDHERRGCGKRKVSILGGDADDCSGANKKEPRVGGLCEFISRVQYGRIHFFCVDLRNAFFFFFFFLE